MEFLWLLLLVITAVVIAALSLRLQISEEEHDEELEIEQHLKGQQASLKASINKRKTTKKNVPKTKVKKKS